MRFTLLTYGSEGDTRPLVGLSQGLMAAGHEVRLFGDRSTLTSAEFLGIPAFPLAGDMKMTVAPDGALARVMREGGDVARTAKAVARIANTHTEDWLAAALADAATSDAILFSGIASYVGLAAGEYLGKPAIGLGLWPISPTQEFASPLLPPWRLTGWLNRLSHQAVNGLTWRLFRTSLNAARQSLCHQAPRRNAWRDYPILYGISRHLVPQPTDWPEAWRICGDWRADLGAWMPPEALTRFLAAGEPPIYVGFGSMAGFDRDALLRAVIGAVAGRRALFHPGWSGIAAGALPDNFHVIDPVPHDWLFPKVRLVVHHGGAGTSHTAARAGIPQVVVPFAGDQFFWADRLARVGVAPRAVPHTRLNAPALAAMIDFADGGAARDRATELAERMRQEQGIADAVQRIEVLTGAGSTTSPRSG